MKTPITYYGGKQQLADDIISMMPPHKIYCEPFFGGGAVFFAKGPSFLEVINDRNDLLITFYKQCVKNFDRLQEKIQNTLHSESEYNKAKRIYNNPKHQSKLNVAWAVWVVTNMSIMGTPIGGWIRYNGTGGSHVGVSMAAHRKKFTAAVYDRLKYVQISCRDAIDVIAEREIHQILSFTWIRRISTATKSITEDIQRRILKSCCRCCLVLKASSFLATSSPISYPDMLRITIGLSR